MPPVRPIFKVVLIPSRLWKILLYVFLPTFMLVIGFCPGQILLWPFITEVLIFVVVMMLTVTGVETSFQESKVCQHRTFPLTYKKELLYSDIKEVVLNRTVLETAYGLGSVELLTHASSGGHRGFLSQWSVPGMIVGPVKNWEAVYRFLQDKVESSRKERS